MSPGRGVYWLIFAAALAVYLTMLLRTLPGISAAAGGLPPFDLRPLGYSPDEAREFLSTLSAEGKAIYTGPQRWLDLFYPALLAAVLAGAAVTLVRHGGLRVLLLVGILTGMFADYGENALVARLLVADSPVTDQMVQRASSATVVKSLATGFAMTGILVALVVAGIKRIYRP